MSDLLPARAGNLFPTTLDRRLGRALERVDAEAELAKRYDQKKIERVAQAAEAGLAAVAHLTALEGLLVQSVPLADARLRAVADGGALAISRIVLETGR